MRNPVTLGAFLVAAVVVSLVWGRSLWYCAERSQAFRRWVFFIMGFIGRPLEQVRSLLLSLIYCGLGLLAAVLFAIAFGLPVSSLVIPLSAEHLATVVLGAVGEISLANLFVELSCRVAGLGGPERLAEMNDIPWMKGVRQLPPGAAPVAAALGGVAEELFFRGVLLRVLTDRILLPAPVSVAIAGVLFYLEQLAQVQTAFQALVIGCGSVAISLVGGMLVVLTGSVVPALLSHASFVVFFMTQGREAPGDLRQRRTEMAGR